MNKTSFCFFVSKYFRNKTFLLAQVGGRVKDVQFGGVTVELGANWVHRLETMIESHIIKDQPSKSVEKSQNLQIDTKPD